VDADIPPGPEIVVGSPITWTYRVSNTGSVDLSQIEIIDDHLGTICTVTWLRVGDPPVTCTAAGTATAGQYQNTATVGGNPPPPLDRIFDGDSSHYYGVEPGIQIEKLTNGVDADAAPGPHILVGEPITWTYIVTNTGDVPLNQVVVLDDQGVEVNCDPEPTLIPLDPGRALTCVGAGFAVEGQYVNIATATALPEVAPEVEDSDPSHYYGIEPGIVLEKLTLGVDADAPPGPLVAAGAPVTWTYLITNTGNVTITLVTLIDDRLGTVDCPGSTLASGESVSCSAFGTAVEGQYVNVATVTAQPTVGPEVDASDPSHYVGVEPGIVLEKLTNGEDADEFPGVEIGVGQPITWTYLVTNTGSVELSDVTVTDDKGVEVSCPTTVLAPDEHMACTASGISQEGPYVNVGTAVGHPEQGQAVSDSDPSHYFGGELIFADDLESGDTSKWDRRVPP
jgi:hypothetical protein